MKGLAFTAIVALLATPAFGFSEADIATLNATGSCPGCDLSGAVLSHADLRDAELSGADLTHADLTSVDLRRANLPYANLFRADLRGANLSDANLYSADLREAVLDQANLDEADLSRAHHAGISMAGAYFCKTVMPNGRVRHGDC